MQYFKQLKTSFEDIIYPQMLLEVDKEMYFSRSLIYLPNSIIGSNQPFYNNPFTQEVDPTLPEGKLELNLGTKEELGVSEELYQEFVELRNTLIEITKKEFDQEWHKYLIECKKQWDLVKKRYKINSLFRGRTSIFRASGVIINLGEDALGLVDYSRYEQYEKKSKFIWGSGMEVDVKITGYDDLNMWLQLKINKIYPRK